MTMDARRKAKQAAATKTAAKPEKKKSNPQRLKGTMRSIAIARRYLENEVEMLDNGTPVPRSVFDPVGHASKQIGKETNKKRVINTSTLVQHLNKTVFTRALGCPLRRSVARMIVDGISDQFLALVEDGYTVKLPNVMTARKGKRAARKARNPRTGEAVQVPARITLITKAARAAKAYLAQGAQSQ